VSVSINDIKLVSFVSFVKLTKVFIDMILIISESLIIINVLRQVRAVFEIVNLSKNFISELKLIIAVLKYNH